MKLFPLKKIYLPAAITLITLLLQGCLATAVVGGSAAVATKTATDPRTVGTQVDDTTLEARVSSALRQDQDLKNQARIVTTAYQSAVLLTGQAPSQELIDKAKKIAMGVEGATAVYDEIRLGNPISLGTSSSDTWITTKVRSQLLTSGEVKSSNIKATTENGEVFLMGIVTPQEGQAAAKIASQISGVTHVTTAYKILK